jgi:DNA-3-methyladenine glycosylase I
MVDIPKGGIIPGSDGFPRCWWCVGDPLYETYHDDEWGRPEATDRTLFEKLSLEAFQSGLSWLTILRKRENFRRAFKRFDIESVARFNSRSVERLMQDAGIVRNRAKIEATLGNARAALELIDELGSLAAYAWSFAPDKRKPPLRNVDDLLSRTTSDEATAMSKDLKRRGWSFVGPTTIYSFMEAMGLVNDHVTGCHLYSQVEEEQRGFRRPVSAPRK